MVTKVLLFAVIKRRKSKYNDFSIYGGGFILSYQGE